MDCRLFIIHLLSQDGTNRSTLHYNKLPEKLVRKEITSPRRCWVSNGSYLHSTLIISKYVSAQSSDSKNYTSTDAICLATRAPSIAADIIPPA